MSTPMSVDGSDETPTSFRSAALARRELDQMMGPMHYYLSIAQQPKRSRMSGVGEKHNRRPIGPVPAVVLEIRDRNGVPCTYPYADTKVLFAIASLLHSEDSLPVAMIQKGGATFNPLHGTLISFCSKINRPTAEDPSVYETVSAFVWPDLSVRHEGLYRLRFHVYEVEDGDVILRGVDISNTLRVYAAKEFPGMADSTPFTELLKNHGLRVRVAKSSRAKRKILHHIRGESSMHHEEQSIYNSMDSEYGGYDINLSTRQSTPEEEDPQESMDVDDMPGMVPPGNVLPVPLHSSPLMSNHNGNRFPENQQTQSLFQSSHPVTSGYYPAFTTQNSWQNQGHLPSISQIHLPHRAGQQQSTPWEPVQESQAVSRPERRNGMEYTDHTFFPPPNNQQGYQGRERW